MRKNIAVILAGGSGQRMGSDVPKQFLRIGGKTILEHTLSVFQQHPDIDEIAVVCNPVYHSDIRQMAGENNFSKLLHFLPNGPERYHSTLSALHAFRDISCNLLIHDAVRPLVTARIIGEVINNLRDYQAVNVAIPATDTIIEVDESKTYITRIPDRERLFQVQTPQGFYNQTLWQAFERALQDPDFKTTDDCSVVKKYLPEEKIKLVEGDISNIKITWPEDLKYAEKILLSQESIK